jgi:hypothetical protein
MILIILIPMIIGNGNLTSDRGYDKNVGLSWGIHPPGYTKTGNVIVQGEDDE